MIPNWKIYPRSQGHSTVYLKNVVKDPTIQVGEYTTYDDYVNDPRDFERNCVLYHYPECNGDTLSIGKFCSIACGAKFIFNAANHALGSLSTYPFPIFFEEWGLPTDCASIAEAWDNHGSITIGNDVWIGYEAVILSGVTIGDGAIIGARAVVTRDIPPYTIAAGVPAKPIRRRFDVETIARLEELHPCNDSFTCKVCGRLVTPDAAGTDHRNHCPNCLSSLHVDIEPGDREADCGGIMEPIAVWVRGKGEWAIIHRCRRCGALSSNRVAADDNPMKLMSIALKPLCEPPFPLERIEEMTALMGGEGRLK